MNVGWEVGICFLTPQSKQFPLMSSLICLIEEEIEVEVLWVRIFFFHVVYSAPRLPGWKGAHCGAAGTA